MADFDTQIENSAPAFMNGFGKESLATYTPKGRPPLTDGVKVIFDPATFAPNALTGEPIHIDPEIQIETATLSVTAGHKDQLEFDGIRVEVESYDGDIGGLTSLSVRVL